MIASIVRRLQFARLCTIHRRSLSTIHKWQSKQLRQIVKHAFQNVVLWNEILTKANIKLEDIKGLEDLQKVPLTRKSTYVGKMVEEYIDSSRRFIQRSSATSGTSGKPFMSLASNRYVLNRYWGDFMQLRFLWWIGKQFEDVKSTRIARIKKKIYSSTFRLGLDYTDFRENPEKAYIQLAEFNPEILIAYAPVLYDIAKMTETNKALPMLSPKYVVSTGEAMTPSARAHVNKQLNSETYCGYGSGEFGGIGIECAMHDGFHINCETLIIEITDNFGQALPYGKSGKVIITDLSNYNMPFIRYDIGDRGFISMEPCICGLNSPRLWLEGRSSTYLMFGNRRISRYEFFFGPFMHSISHFQVVKRSENELLLRVVPGHLLENHIEKKIKESVCQFIGSDINVSIELVTSIPKATSGKTSLLVDESISATS
jgi:phenylacetate-CoA ligase